MFKVVTFLLAHRDLDNLRKQMMEKQITAPTHSITSLLWDISNSSALQAEGCADSQSTEYTVPQFSHPDNGIWTQMDLL